ncbi:MAG: hypothetical protein WKG07_41040 [Hymenobacter sp.]
MEKANATEPKYWNLHTEAQIRLKMKDYRGRDDRRRKPRKKLAMAATPPNGDYVKMDDELIAGRREVGSKRLSLRAQRS